jgi:hypothetical protein
MGFSVVIIYPPLPRAKRRFQRKFVYDFAAQRGRGSEVKIHHIRGNKARGLLCNRVAYAHES